MGTQVERSFRGISERLAVRYLTNLGGEQVADDTVVGDDWTATLSSEPVAIGPSLTLTEVTVVFEGTENRSDGDGESDGTEADPLEPLIEEFAQKAMRAGG
ncbi:hypothetical protein [Natronorubrum sp. DTA7]|uniref:hypothetical protein n=1 Tax=Natronorubrum sp. DTA7 TaxID=3447016 RepID=UPI003F833E90